MVRRAEFIRPRLIVAYLVYRSGESHPAGVEQHHVVGEIESEPYILLDEKDRLTLLLQARDGASDLGDDQRSKAL